MSIGYVNNGGWSTSFTTSMGLTLPSSRSNGNILLACTSVASSRIPSWSAGWTPIGAGEFAYRIVDGTETAPVVTWSGSSTQDGIILQYSGAVTVGADDENQAQTGTTATCSAITTTGNNATVVGVVVATGAPSLPAGFTSDVSTSLSSSSAGLLAFHQTVATAGSASSAISSTVPSGIWRAMLIELDAVAAAVSGGAALLAGL